MDPATVRFTNVDPLVENYFSWSPYVYVGNNPMRFVDPLGKDWWSTNDPEEIEKLWSTLKSNMFANNGPITLGENFNTSSWSHVSDNDFVAGLSFNDETQTFFTSYVSKEGSDYVVNGISIPATSFDGNSAYVESDLSKSYTKASGRIDPINIEFTIALSATSIGWRAVTGIVKYLWNTMSGYSTTNTFDAGKSGFSTGNREKMGRVQGNMPGNNQAQNEQVRSLCNKYNLTKDQKEVLHREIGGQGYGYHEIEDVIKELFGK